MTPQGQSESLTLVESSFSFISPNIYITLFMRTEQVCRQDDLSSDQLQRGAAALVGHSLNK